MFNVAVLQFPGTNCDYDTEYAFKKLGANVSILWHQEKELPENTDLVVVAGGFSCSNGQRKRPCWGR